MIALPELAGRFGDQLLEPGAESRDPRRGDDRELVAPVPGGDAEQRAELHAGVASRGRLRTAGVDRLRRGLQAGRRHRAPAGPPGRGRRARAPSSGRRSSARRTRCGGSRRHARSARASIRGSVMATNWRPAPTRPREWATRSKKYCRKTFGSSVLPDLLATITSVRSRSTRLSTARTCAGSVESSTWRSRPSGWRPNVRASTSGHKLEPPMPSSSACVKPSARASPAIVASSGSRRRPAGTASSQPSHVASSAPVQSEASRAHRRRVPSAASQAASAAFTSATSGAGPLQVCRFTRTPEEERRHQPSDERAYPVNVRASRSASRTGHRRPARRRGPRRRARG